MPAKRSERLSRIDTAWLRMEDPTNLMMVTGVLVFDQPLNFVRLRQAIEQRMLIFDRFHQKVVGSLVTRCFPFARAGSGQLGANIEQQLSGRRRQPCGHLVIGHRLLSSSSITRSASSSVDLSGVSRRSGFFGRWYGLSIPVKWVISPARALA